MLTKLLAGGRYLMVVPVIGCLLLTLATVIMGFGRIITGAIRVINIGDFSAKAAKAAALGVIEIIDLFLIATVSYITAVGLYKLLIGGEEVRLPMRLKIDNLKDLEDKIIGVIVAALAVAFLGHAAGGDTADALLSYGGGIALVIVALAYFMNSGGKKKTDETEKKD